jgi:hypothetical protein
VAYRELRDAPDGQWVPVDRPDDWRTLTPLGPGGRPMARWRPLVAMLALFAVVGLAVVMLSDRAPGLLGEVTERVAIRVDDRAPEARESLNAALEGTAAEEKDVQAHVILWAGVTFLLGLVSWSWRSLAVITVLIAGAATALELLQERLAPTRLTETGDLYANAAGIAVGLVGVVAVSFLVGAPSLLRRRSDR